MSDETSANMIPSQSNVIKDLVLRAKLIGRLMSDRRVSPWIKMIPFGALAYLIWPYDLIPMIPGLSAVDDITVLSAAAYFFVEFCPTNVVMEHVRSLLPPMQTEKSESESGKPSESEVIDGQATDVD